MRIHVEADGHRLKTPRISSYHGDQPFREKVIGAWPWSGVNALGWALPTGYIALDVDVSGGKRGYDHMAQLETDLGELPTTRHQETPSGGKHLVFAVTTPVPEIHAQVPMAVVVMTKFANGTGFADIDICRSGHRYLVVYDASMFLQPVAQLPEPWLKHISKGPRGRSRHQGGGTCTDDHRSVSRALEIVANAPRGNRNNTLNRTVLQNASSVRADADVRDAFIRHAEIAGLGQPEIDRTIDSALAAAERDIERADTWFNELVEDPRIHERRNSADLLLLARRLSVLSSSFGPVVGWSVRDAAHSLGVHRASAARWLRTLAELGYLESYQPSKKQTAAQYLLATPVRNYCDSPQQVRTSSTRISTRDIEVYGGMSQNFPFKLLDDVYCHPAFLKMKGSVSLPKSCARVLVAVQPGARRPSAIAQASELSPPTVRKAVSILQSAGLVQVERDGVVRLMDPDIIQALDKWATWSGASDNRRLLQERHRAERLIRDKSVENSGGE